MRLAVINTTTNIVENIIVPPEEAGQVWFVPSGYTGVMSDSAQIGDTYTDGIFTSPEITSISEQSA